MVNIYIQSEKERKREREREREGRNLGRKTEDRAGYIRNGSPGISNEVCELRPGSGT